MSEVSFSVIILAAGKGTRMQSPLPKVLHPVAGHPMIYRTVQNLKSAGASELRVVVGYGADLVRQVVEPLGATCFLQARQLGTGDAVKAARPETLEGTVVIMNGDHPLIRAEHIRDLVRRYEKGNADLAFVTCELDEPGSYGRVVRHNGRVRAIVEAKDAGPDTLKIRETNAAIYVTEAELLAELLPQLTSRNAQGEYYLTDIVGLCDESDRLIDGYLMSRDMATGVNSQVELAMVTKEVFKRTATAWMDKGVILVDPDHTYIEEDAEIGSGTVIYPGCYIKGPTKIGKLCVIEPNCFFDSAVIADSVRVKAGCYLNKASVADHAELGPYAHLRPETEIGKECKVGNFVEMKKVRFGDGSKASHLTYLGDAIIGKNVNVGCGTITCNYAADKKKYITKVGDNVFVGSDTQFVAPVEIGEGAIIGSGSTITKDVPAFALAVARGKQVIKEEYARRFTSQDKE